MNANNGEVSYIFTNTSNFLLLMTQRHHKIGMMTDSYIEISLMLVWHTVEKGLLLHGALCFYELRLTFVPTSSTLITGVDNFMFLMDTPICVPSQARILDSYLHHRI